MKRLPNEPFEEYRERRKAANKAAKRRPWRIFFTGGTYRSQEIEPIVKQPPPISPAIGKRHKGETLSKFKERRRSCNKRRREREAKGE
ncbi:MAG: hypothetical protein KKD77_21170 [Gammaproteobacteria bacterium]|uniref:Uncharacterized protein n=1 Tax=viral metagenome TaxID=1070528 RepID=A0A6M3L1R0_9ZZZZ|nr:hypothetical protein [Gammaproteobacteria bacterium]